MNVRVVIFARFPTPGKAKTRLIPALGPDGAAALHRRMVELTLAAVRASGLPFELRVTGAPPAAFHDWLGPVAAVDQGEGGLGERLERAGPPYPTIFIGADAPDLRPDHLRAAADALAHSPAAIGPAEDGGYWLLGLARAVPGVFEGVDWGTDAVFAQTLARLRATGVEPAVLPELADLDRPDDLARWPELRPELGA
jgi:hypothetical protein